MAILRSYSELERLPAFEERFHYLSLAGQVGAATFGFDRWMNQDFYRSREWRSIREFVIVRDLGCDLAIEGREIHDRVYIHHMNPMTPEQLMNSDDAILDPEFLITVTHRTHNAIHYGDENQLIRAPVNRMPGDTKLW